MHLATAATTQVGTSVLDLIGKTPLLRFTRVAREVSPVEIYAKAEWYNPGGSVKDRAALAMILEASAGAAHAGQDMIDATSGNTGIAYAMIAAAAGYKVESALPKNASQRAEAKPDRVRGRGCFHRSDRRDRCAQRCVQADRAGRPDRYFYPDQYNNDANWKAHYETTALEIWKQTEGRITHFVTGLGTSGTFMGVTRRLKELNPAIRCISMQPDAPLHGLEGFKHMPTALVPGIYDRALADGQVVVSTEERLPQVTAVGPSRRITGRRIVRR